MPNWNSKIFNNSNQVVYVYKYYPSFEQTPKPIESGKDAGFPNHVNIVIPGKGTIKCLEENAPEGGGKKLLKVLLGSKRIAYVLDHEGVDLEILIDADNTFSIACKKNNNNLQINCYPTVKSPLKIPINQYEEENHIITFDKKMIKKITSFDPNQEFEHYQDAQRWKFYAQLSAIDDATWTQVKEQIKNAKTFEAKDFSSEEKDLESRLSDFAKLYFEGLGFASRISEIPSEVFDDICSHASIFSGGKSKSFYEAAQRFKEKILVRDKEILNQLRSAETKDNEVKSDDFLLSYNFDGPKQQDIFKDANEFERWKAYQRLARIMPDLWPAAFQEMQAGEKMNLFIKCIEEDYDSALAIKNTHVEKFVKRFGKLISTNPIPDRCFVKIWFPGLVNPPSLEDTIKDIVSFTKTKCKTAVVLVKLSMSSWFYLLVFPTGEIFRPKEPGNSVEIKEEIQSKFDEIVNNNIGLFDPDINKKVAEANSRLDQNSAVFYEILQRNTFKVWNDKCKQFDEGERGIPFQIRKHIDSIARSIYRRCENFTAEVSLHYLHYQQSTSPFVMNRAFQPKGELKYIEPPVAAFSVDQNFQKMFVSGSNSLDYLNYDESNSIFSPAAYFFELMLIIKKYVSGNPQSDRSLAKRRPDLWDIPLDGAATYQKIPYLLVVNRVLIDRLVLKDEENTNSAIAKGSSRSLQNEKRLQEKEQKIFANQAKSIDLFRPPFVLPLIQMRSYAEQLETSLHEIVATKSQQLTPYNGLEDYDIALEYLQLSQAEMEWLNDIANKKEIFLNNVLEQLNITSEQLAQGASCSAKQFYKYTGLRPQDLLGLIPQEAEVDRATGYYQKLFVNANDDIYPLCIQLDVDQVTEEIAFLTLDRLRCLAIFTFLAKKLNISNSDLQYVMEALNIKINQETAKPEVKREEKEAQIISQQLISDKNAIVALAKMTWLSKASKLSIANITAILADLPDYSIDVYNDFSSEIIRSIPYSRLQEIRKSLQNSAPDFKRITELCSNYSLTIPHLLLLCNKALMNVHMQLQATTTNQPNILATLFTFIKCTKESAVPVDEVAKVVTQLCTTFNLSVVDLVLLLGDGLISDSSLDKNEIKGERNLYQWLYRASKVAELCDLSILELLKLVRLCAKKTDQDAAFPALNLYKLLQNKLADVQGFDPIANLYFTNCWIKKNKFNLDDLLYVTKGQRTDFQQSQLDKNFEKFLKDLTSNVASLVDQQISSFKKTTTDHSKNAKMNDSKSEEMPESKVDKAVNDEWSHNILETIEQLVIAKFADYFKADAAVVRYVSKYVYEQISNKSGSFASYFVRQNLLISDTETQAQSLIRAQNQPQDKKSSIERQFIYATYKLVTLVGMLGLRKLDDESVESGFDDVSILLNLTKIASDKDKNFILDIDLENIQLFEQIKQLQTKFKDENNNILKYFRLACSNTNFPLLVSTDTQTKPAYILQRNLGIELRSKIPPENDRQSNCYYLICPKDKWECYYVDNQNNLINEQEIKAVNEIIPVTNTIKTLNLNDRIITRKIWNVISDHHLKKGRLAWQVFYLNRKTQREDISAKLPLELLSKLNKDLENYFLDEWQRNAKDEWAKQPNNKVKLQDENELISLREQIRNHEQHIKETKASTSMAEELRTQSINADLANITKYQEKIHEIEMELSDFEVPYFFSVAGGCDFHVFKEKPNWMLAKESQGNTIHSVKNPDPSKEKYIGSYVYIKADPLINSELFYINEETMNMNMRIVINNFVNFEKLRTEFMGSTSSKHISGVQLWQLLSQNTDQLPAVSSSMSLEYQPDWWNKFNISQNVKNELINQRLSINKSHKAYCEKLFIALTNWDRRVFKALRGDKSTSLDVIATAIKEFVRLDAAYTIAEKLNNDTSVLQQIIKTQSTATQQEFMQLVNAADLLKKVVLATQAGNSDDNFDKCLRKLEELKRDVLIIQLLKELADKGLNINRKSDLSQYLLIDVEMFGGYSTSYVEQGIATLQLYLQRCRLGIEKEIILGVPEKWWPWIESYRMWEANRKVLLYPENYIEPDLRTKQSKEFKDFTQALMRSALDQQSIEGAFQQYLKELVTLGSLVPCEAISVKKSQIEKEVTRDCEVIYLFARTKHQPHVFYFRTIELDDVIYTANDVSNMNRHRISGASQWSYWEKIDVQINSPYLNAFYQFNRLFLFWVELKPEANQVKILYVYKELGKTWSLPQTIYEGEINDQLRPTDEKDQDQRNLHQMECIRLINQIKSEPGYYKILLDYREHISVKAIRINWPFAGITKNGVQFSLDKYLQVNINDNKELGLSPLEQFASPALLTLQDTAPRFKISKAESEAAKIVVPSTLQRPKKKTLTIAPNNEANSTPRTALFGLVLKEEEEKRVDISPVNCTDFIGIKKVHDSNDWPDIVMGRVLNTTQESYFIFKHENSYKFTPISSYSVNYQLSASVTVGGIKSLYQVAAVLSASDLSSDIAQFSFETVTHKLDFDGSYGNYYWETFFHMPFYVANRLNAQRNFEQARNWYHYIFCPVQSEHDKTNKVAIAAANAKIYEAERPFKEAENALAIHKERIEKIGSYQNFSKGLSDLNIGINHLDNDEIPDAQKSKTIKDVKSICESIKKIILNATTYYFYSQVPAGIGSEPSKLLSGLVSNIDKVFNIISTWESEGGSFSHSVTRQLRSNLDTNIKAIIDGDKRFSEWFSNYKENLKISDQEKNVKALKRNLDAARKVLAEINANVSSFVFQPFKNITPASNCNSLTEQKVIDIWHNQLFDPHAIATLRPIAYMKAVVMKYIKNLIDWADDLFGQDTRESITLATNLYVMANDLLGDKPRGLGTVIRTVNTMGNYRDDRIHLSAVVERIIQRLENQIKYTTTTTEAEFHGFTPYFSIPENKEFIAYWDLIADRLFKIRHSLNIKGVTRELDLFAPELDVHQLVRAAASLGGGDLKKLISLPVPEYRFKVLMDYAKSFTQYVIQLGGALLSALEKRDSEQLLQITSQQQLVILSTMSTIKQHQKEQALRSIEQMNTSIESVKKRQAYYQKLIDDDLIEEEKNAVNSKETAQDHYKTSQKISHAAQACHSIPNFQTGSSGLGLHIVSAIGGSIFGNPLSEVATSFRNKGDASNYEADTYLTKAGHKRRTQDWTTQKELAENEETVMRSQLKVTEVQKDIIEAEIKNHEQSLTHQNEIISYYQSKFTGTDLFNWIIDQLTILYRQAYELAYDLGRSAERAFQYELNTHKTVLSSNHFNFFRKGLLAGESLMLELNTLEKSHMDGENYFSIKKTISLKELFKKRGINNFKDQWKEEKQIRTLIFEFKQSDFDKDFDGHCNRRIRTLSVTTPALTKPYQNLNLILTQTKSVIQDPSDRDKSTRCERFARSIIISNGVNDTGVSENDIFQGRYLPFEGTGAISSWRLEISGDTEKQKEIYDAISDVIINIEYTAQMPNNSLQFILT